MLCQVLIFNWFSMQDYETPSQVQEFNYDDGYVYSEMSVAFNNCRLINFKFMRNNSCLN